MAHLLLQSVSKTYCTNMYFMNLDDAKMLLFFEKSHQIGKSKPPPPLPSTERNSCQLDWRECETAMILLIFISIKNRNSISWEQSTRRALTYSKIVCTYLYFRMYVPAGLTYLLVMGLRFGVFWGTCICVDRSFFVMPKCAT